MSSLYQPRIIHEPKSIDNIDAAYLSDILCNYHKKADIEVLSFTKEKLKPGLVSSFAGGIFRFRLRCRRGRVGDYETSIVLKTLVSPDQWLEILVSLCSNTGSPRLGEMFRIHWDRLSTGGFDVVEINSYRTFIPGLPIRTPKIYHTVLNEDTEQFWIFMEDISGYVLADRGEDLTVWTEDLMKSAISDMAKMHCLYWNEGETLSRYYGLTRYSVEWIESTMPFWQENLNNSLKRCSRFLERKHTGILKKIVQNLINIYAGLDRGVHTLIHGDFCPWHLCFLQEGEGPRPVLFDWGQVSVDVPQFDLHFFINFLIDPEVDFDRANSLIDSYLECLPDTIRDTIKREDFMDIYNLSVLRYLGTRELLACSAADENKHSWIFRTLRHNLKWAERVADRYL